MITDSLKCSGLDGPYCWALRAVHENKTEPRGIFVLYGWPKEAPEGSSPQVIGVALKIPKSEPIVFNYCPWCGVDLRAPEPGIVR